MSKELISILDEIDKAVKAEMSYAAIALTLSLPDICACLEEETGSTEGRSGARYQEWYQQNVGRKLEPLTANDCWRLRCGALHAGRYGHAKSQFSRVLFTYPAHGGVAHLNIYHDVLWLGAREFCWEILNCVAAWAENKADDAIVQGNLKHLVRYRPNGYPPGLVGVPCIA